MVFITRRWAKSRKYGPYYYLGWYEGGKIRWKYLGKIDKLSEDKLKILKEIRKKHEDKLRAIDQIMRKNKEEV